MPVKIINEEPDPKVVKRCTCDGCGVRLEYVPNDVQTFTKKDYSGGSDDYHFITCPKCNKKVYVKR